MVERVLVGPVKHRDTILLVPLLVVSHSSRQEGWTQDLGGVRRISSSNPLSPSCNSRIRPPRPKLEVGAPADEVSQQPVQTLTLTPP